MKKQCSSKKIKKLVREQNRVMMVSSKYVIGNYRHDEIAPPSCSDRSDAAFSASYGSIELGSHNEFVEAVVNVFIHLFAVSI
jgi:hypothetical protein